MSIVTIKKIDNYDLKNVKKTIEESFSLIGNIDESIRKGSRILLKPNVGVPAPPESGRNTDPRFVEAVVEILRKFHPSKIAIAESSVVGVNTAESFQISGYTNLADKLNVSLIDLKKEEYIRKRVNNPQVFNYIEISKIVFKYDLIINLPKLKTISATPVSIGLKNLKGLISDSEKKRFHRTHLNRAIVDLNTIIKPELTIVDGIVACELYQPRSCDLVLIGRDPVAVDLVACNCIGVNPNDVEYLKIAKELKIGEVDTDGIEIKGNTFQEIERPLQTFPNNIESFKALFPEITIMAKNSCSGCLTTLHYCLEILKEKRMLAELKDIVFIMGKSQTCDYKFRKVLYLGNCSQYGSKKDSLVIGCPFTFSDFFQCLEKTLSLGNMINKRKIIKT